MKANTQALRNHGEPLIAASAAQEPYPPPAAAWYTVGLLFVIYSVAILDRFIIALLVDPIRRDLGLTDFQIGLVQGAFSLLYAIGAVPIGWLVDRWLRRWVIFLGMMCWSVATAACGLASNFWQLFFSRVAVGAGEASLNPAAYSILADSFPRERLTLATAVCMVGTSVGQGMAFILGGVLIAALAASGPQEIPLLGVLQPWQLVFVIVGLPGALLSLLIFTIKEPPRRREFQMPAQGHGDGAGSLAELWGFLRARCRFVLCHHFGFGCALIVQAGIATWLPVYMARNLGLGALEIGTAFGLLYGVCTPIGLVLGGWLIDHLFRRGIRDAHLRVFFVCVLVAIPAGILAVSSDSFAVFMSASAVAQLSLGVMPAAGASALQIVTPSGLRGRVSAVFLLVYTLMGASLGPTLVGSVTEFVFQNDLKVGSSIAAVIAICGPLSAISIWLGMRAMRGAVEQSERVASQAIDSRSQEQC